MSKPSGVDSRIPWNSFLKIVIHAIYYQNNKDVKHHPFEALSTRPAKKRSGAETSETGDQEAISEQDSNHHALNCQEKLRDDHGIEDVFHDNSIDDVEPEPCKKAPRLSSFDMFGPDSPPEPSPSLLTPLFEVSTNSGENKPKTVRLQILSIVGIDRFGYIGEHLTIYNFLFNQYFNEIFPRPRHVGWPSLGPL